MSKTPAEGADQKDAAPAAYLVEPYITEDGITVPPPARPMGPRRLTRYYDEVADYLRAVQRGDAELPETPLFMGSLNGAEITPAQRSLAKLSAMGTIDNATDSTEEQLEVGFDETRATVLEDPLAHVGEQVFGSQAQQDAAAAATPVDFAATVGEISNDTGFVAADSFVEESAPGVEEGDEPGEDERPEASINPEAAAIIARVQQKEAERQAAQEAEEALAESQDPESPAASEGSDADESQEAELAESEPAESETAGSEPAEALETEASDTEQVEAGEGTQLQDEPASEETVEEPAAEVEAEPEPRTMVPAGGLFPAGAVSTNLPAPVRAVDAQGLDLTEIDRATVPEVETGVIDPATQGSSEPLAGAVDSDSSGDVTATDAGLPAPETTKDSGELFIAKTAAREGAAFDRENYSEAPADSAGESSKKGGAAASIAGIVVLIVLLLVVWFFFFQ